MAWADWATFGRYSALAELRFQGTDVRVSLFLRDEPRARSQLGHVHFARAPGVSPPLVEVEGTRFVAESFKEERLETTLEAPAQKQLTWSLRRVDQNAPVRIRPASSIQAGALGVVVLDRGIPLADLGPFDAPLDLWLDAKDPWRSRFLHDARIRQHLAPRSTVKIEADSIRHTLLISTRQLGPRLAQIQREMAVFQSEKSEDEGRRLAQIFESITPFKLNGRELSPHLERIEWVRYDRSGMRPLARHDTPSLTEGVLGVELSYPRAPKITQVDVQWTLFSGQMQERSITVGLGTESFEGTVTPKSPVFSFTRDDAMDPSLLDAQQDRQGERFTLNPDPLILKRALEQLLLNAYQAFVIREEEKAYDRLALSLADPLLESIYLDQRRSLLKQDSGLGGEGRVNRVEVIQSAVVNVNADADADGRLVGRSPAPSGDILWVDATWRAIGEVSHWGHSHPRDNGYEARLGLGAAEDGSIRVRVLRFREGRPLDSPLRP